MHANIGLALDLANLKKEDCVPEVLQALISEYDIRTGFGNRLRPDNFIFPRDKSRKQIIYLTDVPAELFAERVGLPSDPDHLSNIWEVVLEVKEELVKILGGFAEGRMVDLDWLTKAYWNTTEMNVFKMSGDNDWIPEFIPFNIKDIYSFYDAVLRKAIVDVFLARKGEDFKRVRRCSYEKCGQFFFAADLRKSFCGSTCKNKSNYEKAKPQ